jgi:hypothetical protein
MTNTAVADDWVNNRAPNTDRELRVARFLIDLSRLASEHESARRHMEIRESGQILGAELMLVAFGYAESRDSAHSMVRLAELCAGTWPSDAVEQRAWRARATNRLAQELHRRIEADHP